jgi:CDP-glycerol:poly(glycerophosphate) glycerophosphotransferase
VNGVAFFARHRFHEPILSPVCDSVAHRLPAFMSSDRRELVMRTPRVLVLADHDFLEYFRLKLPRTMIGSVRHGLIWKRGLDLRPARASARRLDFLAVGDEVPMERYRHIGAEPQEAWRTGYPQLDPLFRRDPPPALELPPGRPTVLYAPTWNVGLGSASVLGARVADWIRGPAREVNVIIKPHPNLGYRRPDLIRAWRRATAADPSVLLVEDAHADVTPYMLASDLLVSDASSAIFLFLALGRPMVLYTSPHARHDPAYQAEDIVWRWRDVGAEVLRPEDLAGAVREELTHPGGRAPARARRAEELFGRFADGQSHRRIAERIVDLAARADAGLVRPLPGPAAPLSWRILDARNRFASQPLARHTVVRAAESLRLRRRVVEAGLRRDTSAR